MTTNEELAVTSPEIEVSVWKAPPPAWLLELAQAARAIQADTVSLPRDLQQKPAAILGIMLAGRELGLGPMESIRTIDMLQGKPTLSAELKASLAKSEGHDWEELTWNDQECMLRTTCRNCTSVWEGGFTMEEAKQAGLVRPGSAWTTYPKDMLYARAVTRLIRHHCPNARGASFRSREEFEGSPEVIEG